MPETGDVVWLRFEQWKGSIVYTWLDNGGSENGTIEKGVALRL